MSPQPDSVAAWRERTEGALSRLLTEPTTNAATDRLHQAMRYSLLAGGKRLRPVLMFAGVAAIGNCTVEAADLDRVACAIECIHTYSLIHDDLPAMDDDALRRGKPTCHVAFDEATATLAGDALQTLAFELIATAHSVTPMARLQVIQRLAGASGAAGMVGGQAIDIFNVGNQPDLSELEHMHRLKTGALIESALTIGGLLAGATAEQLNSLETYARNIGLAFQVQDDILDETGTTEALGKTAGADAARDKPTYVSLLGADAARQLAIDLVERAIAAVAPFGNSATPLQQLAHYIIDRDR